MRVYRKKLDWDVCDDENQEYKRMHFPGHSIRKPADS